MLDITSGIASDVEQIAEEQERAFMEQGTDQTGGATTLDKHRLRPFTGNYLIIRDRIDVDEGAQRDSIRGSAFQMWEKARGKTPHVSLLHCWRLVK